MAEISDSGGGGGKHAKKGRKKGGMPKVDMTPMVDLAFLLLTFFVLTSQLNKAKTMEMAVPADKIDSSKNMEIDSSLANTIILDGNENGTVYYYHGKLGEGTTLYELDLDPTGKLNVRSTLSSQNVVIQEKMRTVRAIYKSGRLTAEDKAKVLGYVTEATQPNPNGLEDTLITAEKVKKFNSCKARLEGDLVKGEMSDTTFRQVGSAIKGNDKAPFFIVKWGGKATYGDVISVMDELKIGDASKYALTKVSCIELRALNGYQQSHGQPVRVYEELNGPACQEAAPQGP